MLRRQCWCTSVLKASLAPRFHVFSMIVALCVTVLDTTGAEFNDLEAAPTRPAVSDDECPVNCTFPFTVWRTDDFGISHLVEHHSCIAFGSLSSYERRGEYEVEGGSFCCVADEQHECAEVHECNENCRAGAFDETCKDTEGAVLSGKHCSELARFCDYEYEYGEAVKDACPVTCGECLPAQSRICGDDRAGRSGLITHANHFISCAQAKCAGYCDEKANLTHFLSVSCGETCGYCPGPALDEAPNCTHPLSQIGGCMGHSDCEEGKNNLDEMYCAKGLTSTNKSYQVCTPTSDCPTYEDSIDGICPVSECYSHSDCRDAEYCAQFTHEGQTHQLCWDLAECAVWQDSIDGSCPVSPTSGACYEHTSCQSGFYCAKGLFDNGQEYQQCDPVADCALYDDAIDGECPYAVEYEILPGTAFDNGIPLDAAAPIDTGISLDAAVDHVNKAEYEAYAPCSKHDDCDGIEYCAITTTDQGERNICELLINCAASKNSVDNECPEGNAQQMNPHPGIIEYEDDQQYGGGQETAPDDPDTESCNCAPFYYQGLYYEGCQSHDSTDNEQAQTGWCCPKEDVECVGKFNCNAACEVHAESSRDILKATAHNSSNVYTEVSVVGTLSFSGAVADALLASPETSPVIAAIKEALAATFNLLTKYVKVFVRSARRRLQGIVGSVDVDFEIKAPSDVLVENVAEKVIANEATFIEQIATSLVTNEAFTNAANISDAAALSGKITTSELAKSTRSSFALPEDGGGEEGNSTSRKQKKEGGKTGGEVELEYETEEPLSQMSIALSRIRLLDPSSALVVVLTLSWLRCAFYE